MLSFTQVGRHITENREAELTGLFASLNWVPVTPGMVVSFSAGELIKEALATLPGGALSHFAESPRMSPFGLVAIRRTGFKGGPVNIFLADTGTAAVVLATEQIPVAAVHQAAA